MTNHCEFIVFASCTIFVLHGFYVTIKCNYSTFEPWFQSQANEQQPKTLIFKYQAPKP